MAQIPLMVAVLVLGWQFRGHGLGAGTVWIGGVLLAMGGAFGLAGLAALGRGTTPLPRPSQQARLVQTGIYARVRHPLYTSVMLASLGWALMWQSWPALFVAVALIPFFYGKARREERWLREQFPDYADYEQRVPRFLPRFHVRRRR